jgi:hypothetical protein
MSNGTRSTRPSRSSCTHHRLTIAQLTKTHADPAGQGRTPHQRRSKIDGLIAAMKKQFTGLTSKEHPGRGDQGAGTPPALVNTSQLMKQVAKDLHAKARKTASTSSGSGGSGSDNSGYIGDLTWTAGGVKYTVGGGGRSTGGTAASSSAGSTSVAAGSGSSGQHLTIQFATMHVELDLKAPGFTASELQALRKAIRVRGGSVQKVLGH